MRDPLAITSGLVPRLGLALLCCAALWALVWWAS
jgi:hypothetical protein